jgi:hypothetical protein
LIGITGISLALYFHAKSIQERTPLYYVGPRSTIVDSSIATPSPLQVLYKGRPVGNANVVATVVYLWNGGTLPIRAEDVLEPLSIRLESSEILEVPARPAFSPRDLESIAQERFLRGGIEPGAFSRLSCTP